MNETIFFAFPSETLVYQMDKTDEIDETSSTIDRSKYSLRNNLIPFLHCT